MSNLQRQNKIVQQEQIYFLIFRKGYRFARGFYSEREREAVKSCKLQELYCRLVSLVGKVPVYCVRGSGSIPGQTNTKGLKIVDKTVLPLLYNLQMVILSCLLR